MVRLRRRCRFHRGRPRDRRSLLSTLRLNASKSQLIESWIGLVLKLETQAAFTNLPDILLRAMQSPIVGVMIARGDLGVEVGYPRLAEIQEEILWLTEAAQLR